VDERRQEVARLTAERAGLLEALPDAGDVIRGSVVERRMSCGKPTCRCRDDPDARHGPYHHLVTTLGRGRTRSVLLGPDEVAPAGDAIERYRRLVAGLDAISEVNVALLRARRPPGGRLR
jgi:hypothetical protein